MFQDITTWLWFKIGLIYGHFYGRRARKLGLGECLIEYFNNNAQYEVIKEMEDPKYIKYEERFPNLLTCVFVYKYCRKIRSYIRSINDV